MAEVVGAAEEDTQALVVKQPENLLCSVTIAHCLICSRSHLGIGMFDL